MTETSKQEGSRQNDDKTKQLFCTDNGVLLAASEALSGLEIYDLVCVFPR